jgi:hypothetical protein
MPSDWISVRYARAVVSRARRIWLPWHDWQLLNRGSSPIARVGSQSTQSVSASAGVTGTQPRLPRAIVLQNQVPRWRL